MNKVYTICNYFCGFACITCYVYIRLILSPRGVPTFYLTPTNTHNDTPTKIQTFNLHRNY